MENIVIAAFDDSDAALQGLRELQQLDDAGKLRLRAATVVERRPDGTWRVVDEDEEADFGATVVILSFELKNLPRRLGTAASPVTATRAVA